MFELSGHSAGVIDNDTLWRRPSGNQGDVNNHLGNLTAILRRMMLADVLFSVYLNSIIQGISVCTLH